MSANAFNPQQLGLQGVEGLQGGPRRRQRPEGWQQQPGMQQRPWRQQQQPWQQQVPGAQAPWQQQQVPGAQAPWQQQQVPGAQAPWQQQAPGAQSQAVQNPWAASQLQNASGYDPNLAARRVAELEAMVNQLTQQLNAAVAGRLPQQPVANPYAQAPVAPAAQSPSWLSNLPSWLRPAGAQPAAVAPAAAPAASANSALAAIAAAAAAAAGQPVAASPAVAPTPAVALAADGRPQPLVDAIAGYKAEISRISTSTSSMEPMVFSGALHAGGPVYLLPGLMLPHGVQMLSWAYLGRAATAEELAKYQQWTTESASKPNGAKDNFARMMKDIEDRGVFQKIQQKLASGQAVGDLAQEAVAIRQAAAAMLTYAKA